MHSEEQKWKKILPETNYFSWFYRPRINVIPTLPNVTTVPRTAKEIVDAPRKADDEEERGLSVKDSDLSCFLGVCGSLAMEVRFKLKFCHLLPFIYAIIAISCRSSRTVLGFPRSEGALCKVSVSKRNFSKTS